MQPTKPFEQRIRTSQIAGTRSVLFFFLACLLVIVSVGACDKAVESAPASRTQKADGAGVPAGKAADAKVLVTYFHTTFRCPTCKLLEEYSRETVERDFDKEMKEGTVAFRVINVDDSENEHFIKDYSLYTKSLIVSLNQNGEEVRWKNIPDIWKHVGNRERFDQYVKGEIETLLEDR